MLPNAVLSGSSASLYYVNDKVGNKKANLNKI